MKLILFAAVFAVGAGTGMAALLCWLYIKRRQTPEAARDAGAAQVEKVAEIEHEDTAGTCGHGEEDYVTMEELDNIGEVGLDEQFVVTMAATGQVRVGPRN